jgi:hypothetical protein
MRNIPQYQEIKVVAEHITKTAGKGTQTYFCFGEVAEILGCHKTTVPRILLEAGVLVSTNGREKKVSAFDIAELMCSRRVSPAE